MAIRGVGASGPVLPPSNNNNGKANALRAQLLNVSKALPTTNPHDPHQLHDIAGHLIELYKAAVEAQR